MAEVSLGRFEPDKNRFNVGALPDVDNVVPQQDGWGPVKAPVETATVYDFIMSPDGEDYILGGDGNRLITGKLYVEYLTTSTGVLYTDEDGRD